MEISLISNTGIQLYTLPEPVTLEINMPIIRPLMFSEIEINQDILFDWVHYFPGADRYVRRDDLRMHGYVDDEGDVAPEGVINFALLNPLQQTDVLTIGRLGTMLGKHNRNALELIERRWIPLPMFESDIAGTPAIPTNWARLMLTPIEEKCTANKRVYRATLAFDTRVDPTETGIERESPDFEGQAYKHYCLCGISETEMEKMGKSQRAKAENTDVPLSIFRYCDMEQRRWLIDMLGELFDSSDMLSLPAGRRTKFIAYYIYFISSLHKVGVLPSVKLIESEGQTPIKVNMVLDVGNSRTFGLLAEDPLNASFSNSATLALHDLGTGEAYPEPFDMRLCFKEERFGLETGSRQFQWPSILRLGREAMRLIYGGDQKIDDSEQYDTSHSSPKRYLWDTDPYQGQWRYITEKDRTAGPSHFVYMDGLMQQFRSDGSFTPDPEQMGADASYSRSSLMTFAFIEILLQARMQVNSYEFRHHAGSEQRPRVISRVILTCPTAMTHSEQLILRRCMEDAALVLHRYEKGTYMEPYQEYGSHGVIEVIPSVKDLNMTAYNVDLRRSWNYDEATCCQMVYLYSELRRYMGDTSLFFSMYGSKRGGQQKPSLTVASLDIGAGTSDIMVCNYRDEGEAIMPVPLFWESFHTAGDDLVKAIISDVLLENPTCEIPGMGAIAAHLHKMGTDGVAERMHHFFGDTNSMGVVNRRMRSEFNVQVLIPIAHHLLGLLQTGAPDCTLQFKDIFSGQTQPSAELMDFFAQAMGFRFEDLQIPFDSRYMNEIVRRVFEISLRKWAAIFYTYKCDIVIMGGRPCSLAEIQRLMRRLMPVSPNRLISMNEYRVGAWYPGSTDVGHFSDKKGLVAVGALIAYLAEQGRLPEFKLNIEMLKRNIQPTSEYIGLVNTHSGRFRPLLSPQMAVQDIDLSGFPVYLGARQLDVQGYPARVLYKLDYNEAYIHSQAVEAAAQIAGMPPGTPELVLEPDLIASQTDEIKKRTLRNTPLRFTLERDYYEDKERVAISDIMDSEGNAINTNLFRLKLQSRAAGEADWLDTGEYILHLDSHGVNP